MAWEIGPTHARRAAAMERPINLDIGPLRSRLKSDRRPKGRFPEFGFRTFRPQARTSGAARRGRGSAASRPRCSLPPPLPEQRAGSVQHLLAVAGSAGLACGGKDNGVGGIFPEGGRKGGRIMCRASLPALVQIRPSRELVPLRRHDNTSARTEAVEIEHTPAAARGCGVAPEVCAACDTMSCLDSCGACRVRTWASTRLVSNIPY